MSTPLRKSKPLWLALQDPNDPTLNPNYRRSVIYYRALYMAWPEWCADHPGFRVVYHESATRRAAGENCNVDHIIPICSDLVCGLHVPWNLQIMDALLNGRKSNLWWPGMWIEQLELAL